MAILKYTTQDGQVVKVNSYKVNNLVPVQVKGDDPNAVMSQKAVSDEVTAIEAQIDEVSGNIEELTATVGTKANTSDLTALTQTVNGKATKSELAAVDAKADQAAADINDINASITEINNTLGDVATNDALGELENVVTTKANKSALETEVSRATAKEGELATAIGTKAAAADLTAEISRAQAKEGELSTAITDLDGRLEDLEGEEVIDCGIY